jgi:polysaccharide export outer membrane protein
MRLRTGVASALVPVLAMSSWLGGCEAIPGDGPARSAIVGSASASVGELPGTNAVSYALIDISARILDHLTDPGPGSLFGSFGSGRGGSPEILVGVGDTVQITIFESAAGGLFIPSDAGSRPGNYVTLPPQLVDRNGTISVPYAGAVRASGRSLAQIQREIEQKLSNRAIEPQAIAALVTQKSNEVSVVGEVLAPAKVLLNIGGDRVLDVIAKAGGIRWPGYESFVTLQRGARKSTVFFNTLVQNPQENIYLAPGDSVYVYREQRSFSAFGATGQSGQFKFEQERLMLSEAVAKAGGLLDGRADPGQVFLYRVEERRTLEAMGTDLSQFPPERQSIPTIYRTNLRDPSAFFAAQKFPMRHGDVVYVSNADYVELAKFLALLVIVPDAANKITGDLNGTRNSYNAFRR